ncbi:hypothetical protein Tco_0647979 [Tanacetum coccineum]
MITDPMITTRKSFRPLCLVKDLAQRLTLKAFTDEKRIELRTVLNVLTELEKEVLDVNTFTYERLDWSKRSSLLSRSSSETLDEPPKDHGFHSSRDIRSGSGGVVVPNQITMIELFLTTMFRAVPSCNSVRLNEMVPVAVGGGVGGDNRWAAGPRNEFRSGYSRRGRSGWNNNRVD